MSDLRRTVWHQLLEGATVNQIMQLFDLDRRSVNDRLRGIRPTGKRGEYPLYRIAEVAEVIVMGETSQPGSLKNEAMRRKQAAQEKDYWDSQLKRQKFLEQAGDLWRTDKVIDVMASVFKLFRESTVVFIDELEHESGLPAAEVAKAKVFADGLLNGIRSNLLQMAVPTQDDHDLPEEEDPLPVYSDDEIVEPGAAEGDDDPYGDF